MNLTSANFRLRNTLGSLNSLNINAGYLYGLIISIVVPVEYLSIFILIPSALFLLVCCKMPESPVWLMRNEQDKEARFVLEWLRGKEYNVEPEMKELEVIVAEEKISNKPSLKKAFSDRTFFIPLFITCTFFIIQAFSGCDILAYYAITIFRSQTVDESILAIIYQVSPLL